MYFEESVEITTFAVVRQHQLFQDSTGFGLIAAIASFFGLAPLPQVAYLSLVDYGKLSL